MKDNTNMGGKFYNLLVKVNLDSNQRRTLDFLRTVTASFVTDTIMRQVFTKRKTIHRHTPKSTLVAIAHDTAVGSFINIMDEVYPFSHTSPSVYYGAVNIANFFMKYKGKIKKEPYPYSKDKIAGEHDYEEGGEVRFVINYIFNKKYVPVSIRLDELISKEDIHKPFFITLPHLGLIECQLPDTIDKEDFLSKLGEWKETDVRFFKYRNPNNYTDYWIMKIRLIEPLRYQRFRVELDEEYLQREPFVYRTQQGQWKVRYQTSSK